MRGDKRYDLVILVSNDLTHDRRMHRTCNALASIGWNVLMMGRERSHSIALPDTNYDLMRVKCKHDSGPLFYLELIRLMGKRLKDIDFKRLLFVDEDTLGAVRYLKKEGRVFYFDAHELFTEVPELKSSWIKRKIWDVMSRRAIRKIDHCYTVNHEIALALEQKYNKPFKEVHNVPLLKPIVVKEIVSQDSRTLKLVYLGVLNPGRGIREAIEVTKMLESTSLTIIGDGPEMAKMKVLAADCNRISFTGFLSDDNIHEVLCQADIGLNILDVSSKSYYLSLANKFFDYANAGLPSICMNTPTYRRLGDEYDACYFIDALDEKQLKSCIQQIFDYPDQFNQKQKGARELISDYNWKDEERKLLEIFGLMNG